MEQDRSLIQLAGEQGMTFGFGIIPADSLVEDFDGQVPEYVYNEGCEYEPAATENNGIASVQKVPVWSSGFASATHKWKI